MKFVISLLVIIVWSNFVYKIVYSEVNRFSVSFIHFTGFSIQYNNIQRMNGKGFSNKKLPIYVSSDRQVSGASKGTPGDAKCVTEILGGTKNKEVRGDKT